MRCEIDSRGLSSALIKKLLKGVEKLPNGTIRGISEYGDFCASWDRGRVVMRERDSRETCFISVDVPSSATEVKGYRDLNDSRPRIDFKYKGTKYKIVF